MVLDFDALYNETQGSAFSSGKKRYYDDKVKALTSFTDGGKLVVRGRVEGDRTYHTSITFDEQGGLYDYSCDCDRFSLETGPCKHIVATALSYEERNPAAATADVRKKTDAGALNLIAEYGKMRRRGLITADALKTEVVPYVEIGDGVSLRFTIGNRKQYNLKDISDFVSALAACGYRRYGVELELYHIPENFTPASRRLIDFIVKCYNEKAKFGVTYQRFRDELRLLGSDADEFFSLYEGTLVHFGKTEPVLIESFDTPVPVKLRIEEADDGFEVSTNVEDWKVIEGMDYRYILWNERLYRVTNEWADGMRALMNALAAKKRLFVAKADMSPFYNSVIAAVAGKADIESTADLSVYEAAPLVAKVYISDFEFGIVARVEASYDDNKIDILSEMAPQTDFVRDWDAENALRGVLVRFFPDYPDLHLSDEDEIYDFLTEGVKELFGYAEVLISGDMKKLSVRRSPRLKVGVRLSGDLLRLDVTSDDYTKEEIDAILKAYREKRRYIRLGGGFVSLEDNSIEALGDILDVAKLSGGEMVMPRYYAPFVGEELGRGFFSLSRDSAFKTLLTALESVRNADVEVPESLKDVMRNYQKTGFRWLKMLSDNGFGGILADDMGLGKSLQVIALLLSSKSRAIVVCPTTLMLNWTSEIAKFAPSLKAVAVMGGQEERKRLIASAGEYDVVITSYDLIRRDFDLYENEFDYAIADEAQFIKNPETRNAAAVKKIKARHRFALTGTPVENNLGELWSIFDFIMPGYLGTYPGFRDRYESGVVRGDDRATERLKRVVKPFILRRLKAEVLTELPPKTESVIASPLEGEQRKLYESNLALIRSSLKASPDMSRVVVLGMLTKLRQICCDPSLVYPEYTGNSAKAETAMQLIESAVESGHKILLFSQFTSMMEVIRHRLAEKGITYYVLKGDTPKAERLKLVNKFNENDVKVFLISLKAGGTGLNLTGADVVIHYDPWWNESVMNQATDRAYRIGQKRSVQVYKLVVKDSIEEQILKLQERKSALSSLVVGKNNDIKEIIELLR